MTIALVTGAGAGIGRATAILLANKGLDLGLVDSNPQAIEETAELVRATGRIALPIVADVTKADEVEAFVEQIENELGPIASFFANAGIGGKVAPIWEYDNDVFQKVWSVNTLGVFLGLKYVGKRMISRNRGAIVVMTSTSAIRGRPGNAGYISSKHGALGLARVAALDMGSYGVRVNAIAPGPVETEMIKNLMEQRRNNGATGVPKSARTIGQPDDVASVVGFLLSNEAKHVNGAVWVVDGGNTID